MQSKIGMILNLSCFLTNLEIFVKNYKQHTDFYYARRNKDVTFSLVKFSKLLALYAVGMACLLVTRMILTGFYAYQVNLS